MTMTPGRADAREQESKTHTAFTSTVTRRRPLRRAAGTGAAICAIIAMMSLSPGSARAQDAVAPQGYSLRMSTTLTLDPSGEAPAPAADGAPARDSLPADTVAADGPTGYSLALLCAALGFVLGAWLVWRRPKDLTPAQDRLGAELTRSRERYLGLLNQRGLRRDPAWDSTLDTLKSDLALARGLSDRLLDEKRAAEAALEDRAARLQAQARSRETLEDTLATVREELAQAVSGYESERGRAAQLENELATARAQAQSQRDALAELARRAEDADAERQRAAELEATLAATTSQLDDTRQRAAALDRSVADANERLAEMLDKNVSLEAQLTRLRDARQTETEQRAEREKELAEQLRLATESGAQHEARAAAMLEGVRAEHAEQVSSLEAALREQEQRAQQREQALSEAAAAATEQAAQSDQAKRRVLSILQQERAGAGETVADLESLRREQAAEREEHEAVLQLLSTAEDRIDDQESQIAELYEENQQLRRELDSEDREAAQAAREADDAAQPVGPINTLADAQLAIRRLEADLRLRSDLVEALQADIKAEARARSTLRERDEELAILRNELAMALAEASRLRERDKATPRVTPRDVATLGDRIGALEERIIGKERELAILRAAANDDEDDSPLRDHVGRLERDQEASIAVVRYLEGEVKKLSRQLKDSSSQAV